MQANHAMFVLKRWRVAVYLAAGFAILAMVFRLCILPYRLQTTLTIHDAQNSQLQAFTSNFFSLSKAGNAPVQKKNAPSDRAVDELDRNETYSAFLQDLKERAASGKSGFDKDAQAELENYLGTTLSQLDPNSRKTVMTFRDLVKFDTQSPSEVKISISTKSPEMTYFVGNEFLKHALKSLKSREMADVEKVRIALQKQRDYYKGEFEKVNVDLEKFQRKSENVVSLASGANLSTYLSDLMVRKNELELKIQENERTIEFLGGQKAANLAIARDLGQRSEIRQIMDETILLKKQVGSLQAAINKFTSQSSSTVEAQRMYEELKKSAESSLNNFQEANDTLSKLEVYRISIDSKYELMQTPEFEDAKPLLGTMTLLAIALLFSQVVFSGWVYFEYMRLRKPEPVADDDNHLGHNGWVVDIGPALPAIVPRAEIQ